MRHNILWILSKNYLRISLNFSTYINNREVTVELVKKRGLKHTYLRLISDNSIQIKSNFYFTKDDAEVLIEKKIDWLEKNLNQMKKNLLNEDEFLFLGVIHKNLDFRDVELFYKQEAKKLIPKMVEEYSIIMNVKPTSIKFRKNRRTWGSCNYRNELNFNIFLMKFPPHLIEYVVIHELAHIKHKNHSKDFWNYVGIFCSDYKKRIKEFRNSL